MVKGMVLASKRLGDIWPVLATAVTHMAKKEVIALILANKGRCMTHACSLFLADRYGLKCNKCGVGK